MLTKCSQLELPEKTMRILTRTLQSSKVVATPRTFATTCLPNQYASDIYQTPYWRKLSPWKDVHPDDFLSYGWQVGFPLNSLVIDKADARYQKANTIERKDKLLGFLDQILPSRIPDSRRAGHKHITTREDFLSDVEAGMKAAPMSVRLTPHIMSVADWNTPFNDPIIRQFIPLKSNLLPDHPQLTLDSLHEEGHSPVPGLVHRYPDKVLFLGKSKR